MEEKRRMIVDDGLLIVDLFKLWTAVWQGVLIAIPIWIVYLMLKIKFLEWKEYW